MSQCIDCSTLSHISVVYQSLSKELFTCDGFNFCFAHSPLSQFLFCLIVIVAVSVLSARHPVSVSSTRRSLFALITIHRVSVWSACRCLSVCFAYLSLSHYLLCLLVIVSLSVLHTCHCLSVCFTYLSLSQCLFCLRVAV